MGSPVAIVLVSLAIGFAAAVLISNLRFRRATVGRLHALAARMAEDGATVAEGGGAEQSLADLEKMVDSTVTAMGEAKLARKRLEGVLTTIDHGVVMCNENGQVVFVNDNATELVGGDGQVQQNISHLLLSAAEGNSQIKSFDVYGPPRRRLSVSATPLDDNWRTIGGVAVVQDVSGNNRFAEVRREFVDNVTFELKTPVSALGVLAGTLAREEEPAVARSLAERLQREADRVARLIEDLLDLSRVEGQEAPIREPVAVNLVVAQAAERVRPLAQLQGVTINFGEPPQRLGVVGDRRQIVSAVYRLLDNAVKFSRFGSTVEVRARGDGNFVDLSIRDQGIGIAKRDTDRIFERFYRVDRKGAGGAAAGSEGAGLGLAIVRHVAGSHGGNVRVESTEGEGSTFVLRLPAGPPPVPFSSAAAG